MTSVTITLYADSRGYGSESFPSSLQPYLERVGKQRHWLHLPRSWSQTPSVLLRKFYKLDLPKNCGFGSGPNRLFLRVRGKGRQKVRKSSRVQTLPLYTVWFSLYNKETLFGFL